MADPDAQLVAQVAWSADVRTALHRLEPIQRRALRLVYFERRTQEQVATELKLSPRAVARAVATGLQALTITMLATAAE